MSKTASGPRGKGRDLTGLPGLALSAGGARGAYQLGCWKAFDELGISFGAVAGSSIGALNGAFICAGDLHSGFRFWEDLTRYGVLTPDYSKLRRLALRLGFDLALLLVPVPNLRAMRLLKYATSTARLLSRGGTLRTLGREGLWSLERLEPLLKRHLNMKSVLDQPVPLFVTAYSLPRISAPTGHSAWFRLQDYDESDAGKILAASMSLPMVFPSIELNRKQYSDGGISQWMPVQPLYEIGRRRIIAVSTRPNVPCDPKDYPACSISFIKPAESLGRFPIATFRFTARSLAQWVEQGYRDAMRALCDWGRSGKG